MIVSALLAVSLFGLGQKPQVETKHFKARPWTVVVTRDKFAGSTQCMIKGPHVIVQDGVALFDLGAHTDTSAAAYKLDHGAMRTELASVPYPLMDSALLDRTPLDNASNGLAPLSLAVLAGVRHIDIRPNPKTSPVGFELNGLVQALQIETAQGCQGSQRALALLQPKAQASIAP